ncbi:LysR substrate-binding domain-containing protein [Rhodospirillaceae bacterium SYSU D60014]|uniref:LysR substrate-binding domain-containing protein n=1 Tax=Virgifigura deserti TaxID=2268457 RepID=UPI000E6741E8
MYNLNDLLIFVQAVDSGSFAAAGRQLSLPKSTISKRVAELEAALGVRLIHRTSRSFALTDIGRDFYDHARAAVIEAEAAEDIVRRRLAEPSGTARLTTSVPTAQFRLADRLPALARAYPKLEVQLHVTDRFVDLVQEGFDIAIRSHFAPLPDSGLVQRRMGTDRIILVASPDYLAERGEPETPESLTGHDGLIVSPSKRKWVLSHSDGHAIEIEPKARLMADESLVLLESAIAGLGIACLPEMMAAESIRKGELVQALPSWTAGVVTTTILTPHRRGQLPAVRAVIDFLSEDARRAAVAEE